MKRTKKSRSRPVTLPNRPHPISVGPVIVSRGFVHAVNGTPVSKLLEGAPVIVGVDGGKNVFVRKTIEGEPGRMVGAERDDSGEGRK